MKADLKTSPLLVYTGREMIKIRYMQRMVAKVSETELRLTMLHTVQQLHIIQIGIISAIT